jgi:hypothetical protein
MAGRFVLQQIAFRHYYLTEAVAGLTLTLSFFDEHRTT